MDARAYLERINISRKINVSLEDLFALQYEHVFSVPFENLDIQAQRIFDIKPENVFDKVVLKRRGGFCYELNSLFNDLLNVLGFDARILTACVYDSEGKPGPEFDHMCILVNLNVPYLLDVGFGDFALQPLEISKSIQFDGRNYFKFNQITPDEYDVLMSGDGIDFQRKYIFSTREVLRQEFEPACYDKQTNPNSHFVKNVICSLPTSTGRISILNDKFIEKINGIRTETPISKNELQDLLWSKFKLRLL